MAWLKSTSGFVNSDTGVAATVSFNDGAYRLRINGQQLAGAGHASEQDALDYLEQILQGYTLP
jgi:hypothetical protein